MADAEKILFDKLTVRSHAVQPQLAPKLCAFPEGDAMVRLAACMTILTLSANNGEQFVGIIVCADHGDDVLHGGISALTPAEARSVAASLLQSAEQLDPGGAGRDG